MRIISEFHDYYDGVQAYGQDSELFYYRKTIEVDRRHDSSKIADLLSRMPCKGCTINTIGNFYSYRPEFFGAVLGFCGTLYPCWRYNDTLLFSSKDIKSKLNEPTLNCFTSKQTLLNFLYVDFTEKNINNLQPVVDLTNKFFSDYKTPIWLYLPGDKYNKEKLIVNPRLADTGFPRIKDSYSCYQEISQFLGGVLPEQEKADIISIDDDSVLLKKHGFDELSFKYISPGKKAKRQANKARKRGNK